LRPRCVVIWITPFAAREPYSDAAAAPFTISMLSMSMASMSMMLPDRITPSTMYIGSWLRPVALMLVGPRSRIDGAAPGRPEVDTMFAPATLPAIIAAAVGACTGIAAVVRRSTVNGSLARDCSPATPVTTISCMSMTAVCSGRSSWTVSFATTVTVRVTDWKPMCWMRTSRWPAGTPGIRKTPFWSVTVPRCVPVTDTMTPVMGWPDIWSVIRPRIVPAAWALASAAVPSPSRTANRKAPVRRYQFMRWLLTFHVCAACGWGTQPSWQRFRASRAHN
jgi:hypothetical protein